MKPSRVVLAGAAAYAALSGMVFLSVFPLYWMFVVATGTEASISRIPPQITPGGSVSTCNEPPPFLLSHQSHRSSGN